MQRQRDGLVPIGEALADLPGSVQAIRKTPPPAQRAFTRFDQVNQLVEAKSHTAAERGKRTDNKSTPKTRIKSPDSLRKQAGQCASAPPTLCYGPAGDSARPLQLGVLVGPKGSLPAR